MPNIRDLKLGPTTINEFDYSTTFINEIDYGTKTVFLNDGGIDDYGKIILSSFGDEDPLYDYVLKVEVGYGKYPNSYDSLYVLFDESKTYYISSNFYYINRLDNISTPESTPFPLYRGDLYLVQEDTGGVNEVKACLIPKGDSIKEYLDNMVTSTRTFDWALKLGTVPAIQYTPPGTLLRKVSCVKDSYVLETEDLSYIENNTHDTVPTGSLWEDYSFKWSDIDRNTNLATEHPSFKFKRLIGGNYQKFSPHPYVLKRDGTKLSDTAPSYILDQRNYVESGSDWAWQLNLEEPELTKEVQGYIPDVTISSFTIAHPGYYENTSSAIEEIKSYVSSFSDYDGYTPAIPYDDFYFIKNKSAFPDYVEPDDATYNQEIEINYSLTLRPGTFGLGTGAYLRYFGGFDGVTSTIENHYIDPSDGSTIEIRDVATDNEEDDQKWADTEYTIQGIYHKKRTSGYSGGGSIVTVEGEEITGETLRCLDTIHNDSIGWASNGPLECMFEYLMADGVCMTCFLVPYDETRQDTDTATNGEVQRIFSPKVLTIWPKKIIANIDTLPEIT